MDGIREVEESLIINITRWVAAYLLKGCSTGKGEVCNFIVLEFVVLCILSYFSDNFYAFYRILQMFFVLLWLKYKAL